MIGSQARLFGVVVDLYVGGHEWTQQPRPDGALMIRAIPAARIAIVTPVIIRIAR